MRYNSNKNKYGAERVTVDGIKFASIKEATRYAELKILLRAGVITDLQLQPRFTLLPAFTKNGVNYGAITYRADFRVTYRSGEVVIEDVKGYETRDFKLRQKLFEYRFPDLTITVI